jgi:halocyanin-like protein
MTEEDDRDLSRRLFMRETMLGGTAAAGAIAASTTAAAQEEDEEDEEEDEENGEEEDEEGEGEEDVEPDWSSFVEDAPNFDSTDDQRGEEEVVVEVGGGDDGLAFEPPAIWIDEGTEVIWEWTGEGGDHNVNSTDGEEFESDTTADEGFTFEHVFEEEGINEYECTPHTAQDMHGGVAVGEEIETQEVLDEEEGGGAGVELPESARAVGVALTVAFGSTLGLAYVFMKYGGDYEGDRIE